MHSTALLRQSAPVRHESTPPILSQICARRARCRSQGISIENTSHSQIIQPTLLVRPIEVCFPTTSLSWMDITMHFHLADASLQSSGRNSLRYNPYQSYRPPSQTCSPPFTASTLNVPTFNGDRALGASRSTSLISFPDSHTSDPYGAYPSPYISYRSLRVPPNDPFALNPFAIGGLPHSLPAAHPGALSSTRSSEHTSLRSETLHRASQPPLSCNVSLLLSHILPGMVITHRQVDPSNDPLSQDFSPGVFVCPATVTTAPFCPDCIEQRRNWNKSRTKSERRKT